MLLERLEAAGFDRQHLERLARWVDEPGMSDAFARVDAELRPAVDTFGRRRQHFADPIRREG